MRDALLGLPHICHAEPLLLAEVASLDPLVTATFGALGKSGRRTARALDSALRLAHVAGVLEPDVVAARALRSVRPGGLWRFVRRRLLRAAAPPLCHPPGATAHPRKHRRGTGRPRTAVPQLPREPSRAHLRTCDRHAPISGVARSGARRGCSRNPERRRILSASRARPAQRAHLRCDPQGHCQVAGGGRFTAAAAGLAAGSPCLARAVSRAGRAQFTREISRATLVGAVIGGALWLQV